MTTGELIKILQKEDPEGKNHIRIGGGILYAVELKPGYWDGAYDYLNEKGQWVETHKHNKVDFHIMEQDDFIERNYENGMIFSDFSEKFLVLNLVIQMK